MWLPQFIYFLKDISMEIEITHAQQNSRKGYFQDHSKSLLGNVYPYLPRRLRDGPPRSQAVRSQMRKGCV